MTQKQGKFNRQGQMTKNAIPREKREKYRDLVDSLPQVVYEMDEKGILHYTNRVGFDLFGYTDEDFKRGLRALDMLIPEDRDRARKNIEKLMHGKSSGRHEYTALQKNGSTFPILMHSSPIIRDNKPAGLRGILIDITAQKQAEEEQKITEQLLQAMNLAALAMQKARTPDEIFKAVAEEFKKLNFSIIVMLMDENRPALSIKYMSFDIDAIEASEQLVGIEEENFVLPIERASFLKEAMEEGKTVFIENSEDFLQQGLPADKKRFAGQVMQILNISRTIIAPLIIDGGAIGVFLVQSDDLIKESIPAITAFAHQMTATWRKAALMRDLEKSLTELRMAQDRLLQSQKMEGIGRLAGGIAHDFNNFLTAIQGYSDLAMRRIDRENPLYDDLEQIQLASKHASEVTRQLLLFSRKQPMELSRLNVNRMVEELFKLLQHLIGEDIAIRTYLEPGLWTVRADAAKINQVIMNLVVNAKNSMPEGGKLTIRTENAVRHEKDRQTIPDAKPGRYICLVVEDTGTGMDQEILRLIFEPFYSTKAHGIGLGLAVVYGVVKQHQGFIRVSSEPGQGSIFKVYLPAMTGTPAEKVQKETSRKSFAGRGERILVVEDEETVRQFATKALSINGYTVFPVKNAREALLRFQKEDGHFQMVFTDIVLPDQSGFQLAEELLRMQPELTVLLTTGYTEEKAPWPMIREKGFRFLQKPYGLKDLLLAVMEAIQGADH